MSSITAIALILTACLLAYKSGKMSWSALPAWRFGGKPSMTPTQDVHEPPESTPPSGKCSEDGDTTPKAAAVNGDVRNVPIFSLTDSSEGAHPPGPEPSPVVPSFPAPNSAQRASNMAPPARKQLGSTSLMPPPSARAPPVQRAPPPSAVSSLRISSSGPLPNRGPPANSQQRVTNSLAPTSAAASTPNAREKVLLSPGHSPMDWAALTRTNPNLSGTNGRYLHITPSELKRMTGRKGKPAWSSWQNRVYNITPYLPFHPGGEAELMKAAGRDGGKLFMEVHPWVNWENMLGNCLVGMLVSEAEADGKGKEDSPLEGLD